MILGGKIFIAFFMTALATGFFYRSWKVEEEHGLGSTDGKVYVWLSPLVFPLMIVLMLVNALFFQGVGNGLNKMLDFIASIFLFLSLYFLVLLLILPLMRKFFSARVCAVIWMVPVFVYYMNYMPFADNWWPLATISLPIHSFAVAAIVWLAGFAAVLAYQIISHLWFRHKLLKDSQSVESEEILKIWDEEQKNFHMDFQIPLVYCGQIRTPLSMGVRKKKTITMLPKQNYSAEELHFLFQHELHHIQRCDVETKVFLGFCKAICWFNPLVWLAVFKASEDLELSCDEIVLREAKESERRSYAELLLKTAGDARGYSTCLSARASSLRYRLKNVVQPWKKCRGIFLFACILFTCFMINGMVLFTGPRQKLNEQVLYDDIAEEIESVQSQDGESVIFLSQSEKAAFIEKLGEIEVEPLYSSYEYENKNEIAIMLSENKNTDAPFAKRLITISDHMVSLQEWKIEENKAPKVVREEYYVVKSSIPEVFIVSRCNYKKMESAL